MNHNIDIRKATRDDLEGILELVVELAIYEKEPDAVTATLIDYQEAWDSGLIDCIVAVENDKIIGTALFYDTFSTWKGKMMYLEDFVVSQAYRGKGIGKLIYERLFAEAEKRKAVLVKWQVIDWNEGAIRFYERNGATIEKEWWNVKKYL